MHYKKGVTGIQWYFLLFTLLAVSGMIFFNKYIIEGPDLGEPFDLHKSLEQSTYEYSKFDGIIQITIDQSISDLFKFINSKTVAGCESYLGYPLINDENKESCLYNRQILENKFKDFFEKNLNTKKNTIEMDMDYSSIDYDLSINEQNGYFALSGNTNNKIKIPIFVKENEVGNLFFQPKFSLPINFNFNEAEEINKIINKLFEECQNSKSISSCINENKDTLFSVSENLIPLEQCESEEKETFLNFVEYAEGCVNSEIPDTQVESPGCPCRGKHEGSYTLSQSGNNLDITGTINGMEFNTQIENLKLRDSGEINDVYILHKYTDGILIEKDFNPSAANCKIKPKTSYRFCVSGNNKFLAYDEEDGQVEIKDIVYKFALDFGEKKQEVTPTDDEQLPLDLVKIDRNLIACDGSCQLRKETYDKLEEANQEAINQGLVGVYVYSSYRDLKKQIALWEGNTPENYADKYPNVVERRKYVCYPYGDDVYERCPHLTGKSVDVRIAGKSSNDEMSGDEWEKLSKIMTSVGWVRYGDEKDLEIGEKWHFEYGTTRWARARDAGVTAIV